MRRSDVRLQVVPRRAKPASTTRAMLPSITSKPSRLFPGDSPRRKSPPMHIARAITNSRAKCHQDRIMRLSAYSRTAAGRGCESRVPQREQNAPPTPASKPHCAHLIGIGKAWLGAAQLKLAEFLFASALDLKNYRSQSVRKMPVLSREHSHS